MTDATDYHPPQREVSVQAMIAETLIEFDIGRSFPGWGRVAQNALAAALLGAVGPAKAEPGETSAGPRPF